MLCNVKFPKINYFYRVNYLNVSSHIVFSFFSILYEKKEINMKSIGIGIRNFESRILNILFGYQRQ